MQEYNSDYASCANESSESDFATIAQVQDFVICIQQGRML